MDKTGRNGLRVGDITSPNFKEKYNFLVAKHAELLKFYNYEYDLAPLEKDWFEGIETLKTIPQVESEQYINDKLNQKQSILAEGAQGSLLDIDFGSYPFVTSSNTICAGACTGLGIAPNKIGKVFGIFKAYCTRVGSGPFPTELEDETGELLRKKGAEFGSTTGRPRRCGWLDIPALKYAIMINGVTELIMMKADVLSEFDEIKICTHYELNGEKTDTIPFDVANVSLKPIYKTIKGWSQDLTGMHSIHELPQELIAYIEYIEKEVNTPISIVSVGPDRTQTIIREAQLA
jgi:adenylosuccinate synthase